MHRLTRKVRFSVNPFLSEDLEGANSFASKPAGEGLAVFLELSVEVIGEVNPATGFVVNVYDIDTNVRRYGLPVFAERIKEDFRKARHISFFVISELLRAAWDRLNDKFEAAKLGKLSLKLNPSRAAEIDSEDLTMVYFSEKFEFAATHKLWNDDFSEQKNLEVFGKCANPAGHGHNYIVEITVKILDGGRNFRIGDFEKIVDKELIKIVDHKNLNLDVEYFGRANPTVENITSFAWDRLAGRFGEVSLHCVTVWENDKTFCSFRG
ncbi:MAG: 6-carboxytetrahydropterin synthase [Sedimentisphaerales bacterium]|nr:6-carboxytetrahydropterin synthase [Sedimentisphaerales bacterium]